MHNNIEDFLQEFYWKKDLIANSEKKKCKILKKKHIVHVTCDNHTQKDHTNSV